jgi:preprotein translocase subunit SecD
MRNKMMIRLGIVIAVLGFSLFYLYPTMKWYSMSQMQRENLEKFKDNILGKILNLGLDLRGGMNLILELDVNQLKDKVKINDALDQAIEIIRNRVDQYGVAEPIISKQGEKWISVQLPGIKNPERAIDLIGKTALLEFKLVAEDVSLTDMMDDKGDIIPEKVPAGLEVLPGKEERFVVVKKDAVLTGAYITKAEVKIGGTNNGSGPYVALSFDKEGAVRFGDITGSNINKRLAIVLDGVVQSAPVIRSRIPDGNAIIEGNFTSEDAKNLAIILRAGALPAPVTVIQNKIIGPTLGMDSIKKGSISGLIGLALIIMFMIIYYKFSGIIADFALFLNTVILLGVMAYFHSTLTLPGIAGIILTIGMAVDANVLICERIKDELRAGKTLRIAVDAGYNKAFVTILDSNVTTLIAAACLFQFGTGPVKGFAVTLTIGLLTSMFTGVVVTKLIYDGLLQNPERKTISI